MGDVGGHIDMRLESFGPNVARSLSLAAEDWDLVILDSKLPDGRGEEYYVRVVRPRYDLPAVLFSGSDDLDPAELIAAGMAAVVQKPARSQRLLEAIRRALLEVVRPAGVG